MCQLYSHFCTHHEYPQCGNRNCFLSPNFYEWTTLKKCFFGFTKIEFMQNLSDRKMIEFLHCHKTTQHPISILKMGIGTKFNWFFEFAKSWFFNISKFLVKWQNKHLSLRNDWKMLIWLLLIVCYSIGTRNIIQSIYHMYFIDVRSKASLRNFSKSDQFFVKMNF